MVRIPKEQGIWALWRGNLPNVIRFFPTQGLNFGLKDAFKPFLDSIDKNSQFGRYLLGNLACGAASGAISTVIVYPLDFARTRMAADIGKSSGREFNGLADCMVKTFKADGFIGLYRGFVVSVQGWSSSNKILPFQKLMNLYFLHTGTTLYRSLYFGLYDTVIGMMSDRKNTPMYVSLPIAIAVSNIAGIVAFPFDTVRRRMMMQSGLNANEVTYKNTLHCWTSIAKQEGFGGFFNGLLPFMFRSIGLGFVLVMYDEIKKLS